MHLTIKRLFTQFERLIYFATHQRRETEIMAVCTHFKMWQSLLVYNACPQPLTEATVLVGPFLLQIGTFGK